MLAFPSVAWSQAADWTVYSTSNSGLPHNSICSLACDARGNVWIGTRGGLAVCRHRPVVDFNGDGLMDIKDLLRLIESWGQDDSMVDIGPPFGHGVVDVLHLELLMSYWPGGIQSLPACSLEAG